MITVAATVVIPPPPPPLWSEPYRHGVTRRIPNKRVRRKIAKVEWKRRWTKMLRDHFALAGRNLVAYCSEPIRWSL